MDMENEFGVWALLVFTPIMKNVPDSRQDLWPADFWKHFLYVQPPPHIVREVLVDGVDPFFDILCSHEFQDSWQFRGPFPRAEIGPCQKVGPAKWVAGVPNHLSTLDNGGAL